jgi:uncharacterized spore protein YtfJ
MEVENLLAKVSDHLSVRRAFGAAYERDGMLVIPVAMVAGGGGAGASRGRRPGGRPGDGAASDVATQDSDAVDVGGGFGGLVLPMGTYVVKGDQVRWVPAVDVTILTLASLSLARLLVGGLRRRSVGRGK